MFWIKQGICAPNTLLVSGVKFRKFMPRAAAAVMFAFSPTMVFIIQDSSMFVRSMLLSFSDLSPMINLAKSAVSFYHDFYSSAKRWRPR